MTAQTVARKSLLGGVTFLIIHAVVAAVWRRIILADTYETNGFFDFDEPSALVVLGALAAYFLTGLFMSMLYGHFSATSSEPLSARVFAVLGILLANIPLMSMTLEVSQLPMLPLNDDAPKNIPLISVTVSIPSEVVGTETRLLHAQNAWFMLVKPNCPQ